MWKSKKQAEWEYKQIKKDIRIVDYASSIGLTVSRAGRYYTLKEHNSVRIDPDRNIFIRNSNNKAGSIIDFAVEFTHRDVSTVLTEFTKMIYDKGYTFNSFENPSKPEDIKKSQQPGELILPERDNTIKNVFAYLVSTRKIDKEIVSRMIQTKNLYQDKRKNCVFISYDQDGKPVFAGIRGTNPNKRFMGDIKGCDYEKCFFIDNKSRSTIVTESVIDGMSMMTFVKGRGEDYNSYNYLMLGSANKYESVFHHMNSDPNKDKWILCLDNDTAGRHFTEKIKEKCKIEGRQVDLIDSPPKLEHDWNKELQTIKDNNYRYDYFIPDKAQESILEKILNETEKEMAIEKLQAAQIPKEIINYIEKFKRSEIKTDSLNVIVDHFNRQNDNFLDNSIKRNAINKAIER